MAKQKTTKVTLIATEKGVQTEYLFDIDHAHRILRKEWLTFPALKVHNIWTVKEGEAFQFIEGNLQKVLKKDKKKEE